MFRHIGRTPDPWRLFRLLVALLIFLVSVWTVLLALALFFGIRWLIAFLQTLWWMLQSLLWPMPLSVAPAFVQVYVDPAPIGDEVVLWEEDPALTEDMLPEPPGPEPVVEPLLAAFEREPALQELDREISRSVGLLSILGTRGGDSELSAALWGGDLSSNDLDGAFVSSGIVMGIGSGGGGLGSRGSGLGGGGTAEGIGGLGTKGRGGSGQGLGGLGSGGLAGIGTSRAPKVDDAPEEVTELVAKLSQPLRVVGLTNDSGVAAGVLGGVEGGAPDGVEGGVPGGVPGGVLGGVLGGSARPARPIAREIAKPETIDASGTCVAEVRVDEAGRGRDVRWLDCPEPLQRAARKAALRSSWHAAGEVVGGATAGPGWTVLRFRFE